MTPSIIQQIERDQIRAVTAQRMVPEFSPGDTVRVMVKVVEVADADPKDKRKAKTAEPKTTVRLQAYEGVVMARSGSGLNESFTVRKISYGEGVERVFPVNSPNIEKIEIEKESENGRARLYYLRTRTGKAAMAVKEKRYEEAAAKA